MNVSSWARVTGRILHGGDYNPEQWAPEIWTQDMVLLQEAGITSVTLNVFAWASLQPAEGRYDFARLGAVVRTVADAGMSIVMATSTAALPPWMSLAYPQVNRIDEHGVRARHGRRHNACMSSPVFRTHAAALAGHLAQRYSPEPSLVAWHVSNEYGGFCWCDLCAAGFREWLAATYGTPEALVEAWGAQFWGHTYGSFDEVFPPDQRGDALHDGKAVLPAAVLDYRRFFGELVRAQFREEKAAIRAYDPQRPVTTNMMGTFPDLDYLAWSDDLDVVSWDSYPAYDTTPAQIALRHDLMRAVGRGRPWMLMEQTPSRQNWQPYNSLKRPGQLRAQSWQAIGHGADTVQYFQLRQSRSGCEKFHGAVIGTDGSARTRTFREVAALGEELARVSPRVVGSRVEHGQVAVVFDWPSRWAIELSAGPSRSLDYVREVERWYGELHRRGIAIDVVGADAGPEELAGYAAVVAPCLYVLDDERADALRAYVAGGGRLLLTAMSALADRHDRLHLGEAPVPLRDLVGVWAEETDALPPGVTVPLVSDDEPGRPVGAGEVLCDVVQADPGTQVLARYAGEYYAGTPALTWRPAPNAADSPGAAGVLYSATFPDAAAVSFAVDALVDGTQVRTCALPSGVEVSRRVHDDGTRLHVLVNGTTDRCEVRLDAVGTDLLTGERFDGTATLAPFGVVVLEQPAD